MTDQNSQIDVFLNPGEIHFGDRNTRIRTFLGSCVSIVFWHPELRKGGMCHFMLPGGNKAAANLDGRYADEAIALLLGHIESQGRPRREYHVKLFGGGDMFPCKPAGSSARRGIGTKNISAAHELIAKHGFTVDKQHLGGHGHRVVTFDVASGEVLMKHVPVQTRAIQNDCVNHCDFNTTIANSSLSDTKTANNTVTGTHLTSNPTGIPCNQLKY